MTPVLRAARDIDAEPCAEILREWIRETEWFPSPHPPASDAIFTLRKIRDGAVTIAQMHEIAGFSALENEYVSCLYVKARYRCHGIGRMLLDQAKSRAARLSLWTFQANTKARAFYLREGFREVRRTEGSENEEGLPDVQYLWEAVT